ncbi:MAG TPA: hypothetical protein VLJ42_13035 [Solirubrobacteraceae bacterium]|nr:hypothetical protein [Solirubrobacteraceae bacterium]
MKVDWAIPCRYAEAYPQGGTTIIGAGSDAVLAPHVPMPAQVLFAVRYVGAPDELDGEMVHAIACRIFDPDGTCVGEQKANLTGGVTQLVPGYTAELTVPTAIVIDARQYGTYSVEFEIDGHTERVPIHIIEPPND